MAFNNWQMTAFEEWLQHFKYYTMIVAWFGLNATSPCMKQGSVCQENPTSMATSRCYEIARLERVAFKLQSQCQQYLAMGRNFNAAPQDGCQILGHGRN